MSETQTYGFVDMLRYLQHKMTQQEMHDFEKALMNDPFLADAFEGFSATNPSVSQQHIEAIEQLLTNNGRQAKVVPLPVSKIVWWKIAAIVLLVLTTGAVAYTVLTYHTNSQQQLASKLPEPSSTRKDAPSPEEKPLAQLQKAQPAFSYKKTGNAATEVHADAKLTLTNSKKVNNVINIINSSFDSIATKEPPMTVSSPAIAGEKKELAMLAKKQEDQLVTGYQTQRKAESALARSSTTENIFEGKVVDKSGDPLPFANVTAGNHAVNTTTDANGHFILKAPDSALNVNVTSTGFTSAHTKISSNTKENTIALKENELSLAEVVVSNLAKKKKNVSFFVQLDTTIAVEPVGGWKNFKQYLNEQFDSLEDTNTGQLFDDNFVINFSIDKQGKPTDIRTPSTASKTIAEKAIEIITNGPLWKGKNDKKVKVVITPKG